METMRFSETKKSSKGFIIAFVLFVIIGGGIIYYSLSNENNPPVVGKGSSETQSLVNLTNEESEQTMANASDISYKVEDKVLTDSENKNNKCSLTIPVISVNGEKLETINADIEKKYNDLFSSIKGNNVNNSFTYKVTYKAYDNIVSGKKILSITVNQRLVDDAGKKNATEKVDTYNINLATKELIKISDIAINMYDKDYKTKINSQVREYVVSKRLVKESDYTYAVTGLENFYIKDSKLHIVFNSGEIVKDYLDIELK